MKIISFVFFLSEMFGSLVHSGPPLGIMCVYLGFKSFFNVTEIPERCESVLYGYNYFNEAPTNEYTTDISALKSAGKIVYMIFSPMEKDDWMSIITSTDATCLDSYIAPMMTYLSENKIDGVFLSYLSFLNGTFPGYANKVNDLVVKIKKNLPSIKVGIYLSGGEADRFTDKTIFDFTATNANADMYAVDMFRAGSPCVSNSSATGGKLPITTTEPHVISIEKACNFTSSSAMDQSKVIVNLIDLVTTASGPVISYTNYCKKPSPTACADSIDLLYNQVIYFKKVFKGIMISYMEYDDITNVCGCGKFPVANTFMDAWQDKPIKCCEKIG